MQSTVPSSSLSYSHKVPLRALALDLAVSPHGHHVAFLFLSRYRPKNTLCFQGSSEDLRHLCRTTQDLHHERSVGEENKNTRSPLNRVTMVGRVPFLSVLCRSTRCPSCAFANHVDCLVSNKPIASMLCFPRGLNFRRSTSAKVSSCLLPRNVSPTLFTSLHLDPKSIA